MTAACGESFNFFTRCYVFTWEFMPVAVVVGAGPGISRSVALKFAREGFHLGLVARRVEKLQTLGKEIEALGVRALLVQADASSEEDVQKV